MAMSSSAILQSIPNDLEQARRRNVLPIVAILARTRLKTKGALAWGQRRKSDAKRRESALPCNIVQRKQQQSRMVPRIFKSAGVARVAAPVRLRQEASPDTLRPSA